MSDKKYCVRCTRSIDRYAKSCVYCNWDQAAMPPTTSESTAASTYVPPPDNRARNRLLGIAALVSLVIIAFVVGMLIHGFEPSAIKTEQTASTSTQVVTSTPHSPVTLVPATDGGPAPVLEQPITSAPAQTPGQEPNDATALPSDQYAAIAAQARAQKAARNAPVDPRTLRGNAYQEPPHRERTAANPPMASSSGVVKTEAYPEYKPLPSDLHLVNQATARLTLTVGADGQVKDVDITEPIPGATPQLIAAVQRWKFRPATENGIPVPARVAVTITLHGNNE